MRDTEAGKNVILFGFMGTGKTVVGKEVARRLGMKFVDMDDVIEEKEGCTISEIFAQKGERHFREVESEVAGALSQREGLVIATGGGVVLNRKNVEALQSSGTGICLTASPQVIYERVKGETHRPLLMSKDPLGKIKSLLEYREPFYATVQHRLDTSQLSVEGVVEKILALVKKDRSARVEH
jgi:shikimate kinase